jgi:PrpF protein
VIRLRGELIRGGTSKCWIFAEEEIRDTGYPTEELLVAAFNARDARQADGIGGASSTTSKAAIVAASSDPGIDVDYTFAQVGVGQPKVEWASNCGNCATAVALWAAHRGHAIDGSRSERRSLAWWPTTSARGGRSCSVAPSPCSSELPPGACWSGAGSPAQSRFPHASMRFLREPPFGSTRAKESRCDHNDLNVHLLLNRDAARLGRQAVTSGVLPRRQR